MQQEYTARNAVGEFANLLKNENEASLLRATEPVKEKSRELTKPIGENQTSKSVSSEKTKLSKETEKLSMDDLENVVRQQVAKKEIAQSLEILIGI